MEKDNLLELLEAETVNPFNYRKLLYLILKYWYAFVICGIIGIAAGYFSVKLTNPQYSVKSLILVKDKSSDKFDLSDAFEKLQIQSDEKIENHIGIISSYSLNRKAIQKLQWKVSWFKKNGLRSDDLYQKSPFSLVADSTWKNVKNVQITMTPLNRKEYQIEVDTKASQNGATVSIQESGKGTFGHRFRSRYFNFVLMNKADSDLSANSYHFILNDPATLALNYQKKLQVSAVDKTADLIRLQISGSCPQREIDYLNELGNVYIAYGLKQKNQAAENALNFIDTQLKSIVDTLESSGSNFAQFRSKNNVYDLDNKASLLLSKLLDLESQQSMAKMQLDYYHNLNSYLTNAHKLKKMMAPSIVGITDANLVALIQQLNSLYTQKEERSFSLTDNNPGIRILQQEIRSTQQSLRDNIENLISNTNVQLTSLENNISQINKTLKQYPETEQQLLNIKRRFELNNQLYTYLLQKRAETQITKASNLTDVNIVDPANIHTTLQTAPKKRLSLLIGLLLGLLVPFGFVYYLLVSDKAVHTKEDISQSTTIPVIGEVIHNKINSPVPATDYPSSVFAESLRTLRTNLNYLNYQQVNPIIGIHSVVPGEGKSFIAKNIAAIIGLNNQKVLLLAADMRNPSLSRDFNIHEKKGLSSYLIGTHHLDEIIHKNLIDNVDFIPSGPVPPNPAELLGTKRFGELLSELRKRYQTIIIDNAPSRLVTDAAIVRDHTTIDLFIVRESYSDKSLLEFINQTTNNNQDKKCGIVLNDISPKSFYSNNSYYYKGYYHKAYGDKSPYFNNKKS